ncbi:hypothetical protein R3P38DRAFT_2778690 [Favolaschia claudopus]|uniref:Uncharacterized protein n=1 Tax=Favolaschia claudopus TaxID=2862362 RepID=A0AAW0BG30_9AGAR
MGNPSTDSVKEAPGTREFSPRSTPWEGIQPKIVIHPLKPLEFTPRPSYGNGEFRAQFRATGPRIHGNPLPDFETAHSIERNPLPLCENVLELSGIHCHLVKSRLKWVESTATLESTANNKLKTLLIADSKAL